MMILIIYNDNKQETIFMDLPVKYWYFFIKNLKEKNKNIKEIR